MQEWADQILLPAVRAETKQEDMLGQPSCSRDDEPLPARNLLLGESWGGNTNNNLR